jgi:hypothetical protein
LIAAARPGLVVKAGTKQTKIASSNFRVSVTAN